MGVRISTRDGIMTAMLEGDLDHHSAKNMRESIDYEANKKKPKILKLDFGSIQFMDSSGIGLVMGRYRLLQSIYPTASLEIKNVSAQTKKIMELAGLGRIAIIKEFKNEKNQ